MNNRIIKASIVLFCVALLVYVGVQIRGLGRNSYTSQTVYEQSVVQSISLEGVFTREETVIPIDATGVVIPAYSVGTKVAVGTVLGSVYLDSGAVLAQYRIQNIQGTIRALEKAQELLDSVDVVKPDTLNGQADSYVSRLISIRDGEELEGLSGLREGLTEVLAKRAIVVDKAGGYEGRISDLRAALAELQSQTNEEIHSFSSTVSGFFVDHIDGMEGVMTPEYEESLSAPELQRWIRDYPGYQADQSAVKIASSHYWIFSGVVTEEQAQSLSEGGKVTLRFSGQRNEVAGKLLESQRDPESGLYKIRIRGDSVSEYLLGSRVQTAEIVVRTYQGLKIPKEAIRFQDGQMGVYVQNGNMIYFRRIEQIFETTDYVLSRTYSQGEEGSAGYVRLYDTIIVKGKDLYDQKLVQ